MIIVGLDAASRTGFAVLERAAGRERVHAAGVLEVSPGNVEAFAAKWAPQVELVVVEDPYLRENVKTLKVLAGIAAVWQHAFEFRSVRVERCTAQSWQTGILTGLITGRAKREERKAAAQLWALRAFLLELPEDAADALGMAVWIARKQGLGGRPPGGAGTRARAV